MASAISTIIGKGEIFFPGINNGYVTHQQNMTLTMGLDTITLNSGDKFLEINSVVGKRWQFAFEAAGMNPELLAALSNSATYENDVLGGAVVKSTLTATPLTLLGSGSSNATNQLILGNNSHKVAPKNQGGIQIKNLTGSVLLQQTGLDSAGTDYVIGANEYIWCHRIAVRDVTAPHTPAVIVPPVIGEILSDLDTPKSNFGRVIDYDASAEHVFVELLVDDYSIPDAVEITGSGSGHFESATSAVNNSVILAKATTPALTDMLEIRYIYNKDTFVSPENAIRLLHDGSTLGGSINIAATFREWVEYGPTGAKVNELSGNNFTVNLRDCAKSTGSSQTLSNVDFSCVSYTYDVNGSVNLYPSSPRS